MAAPLPECRLCEAPTRRESWEANGELCTPCATGIADTVRLLPARSRVVDLDDLRARRARGRRSTEALDDPTTYVERYVPPVPGQLELPTAQEAACRWAHGAIAVALLDDRGLCPVCAADEEE